MKTTEIEKNTEKKVYSLKVFSSFAEEFDVLCGRAAGTKGEQLSAGIMAYMGLYELDKGLVSELMDPDINRHQAAALIRKSMKELILREAFETLTPEQQVQLLQDSRQSERKVLRKK